MKLRYEAWSNGKTCPIKLDISKEQNQKTITIHPTQWSVAWHHPEIRECFCIRHFNCPTARKLHIQGIKNENSFKHD